MSNVATSRSYLDFSVIMANDVTEANSWLLIQDNLPNSNGGIGNTYRITPKVLVAAAGNVQISSSNSSSSNSQPATSRRYIDFPVSSNVSLSNTWVLVQDNLPNSNGGIGNTYRLTIPTIVKSVTNTSPLQLYVANSIVNLPAANQYPSTIVLVANASTGALSVYSSNGSEWSTAQGGAAGTYTADSSGGLQLSGSAFSVKLPANSGLVTDSTGTYVNNSIYARKFSANVGDGSSTTINLTHGLGTQDVIVQLRNNASPFDVQYATVECTNTTVVSLIFSSAPSANGLRATVIG